MGSGGGGGGGSPSGERKRKGGGSGPIIDPSTCELTIKTDLSAIDYNALLLVKVGDELIVGLNQTNGFDAVVCRTTSGDYIGTVSHIENLAQLIGCIRRGVGYIAATDACGPTFCSVMITNR